MQTTHTTFSLAGITVHQIAFDPATYTDADLLWLPHHPRFASAGRKRKTDHLAGRIAAFSALKASGTTAVPGIGNSGEPLWPAGISGSITHSGTLALAVAGVYSLIGIDYEAILDENEAIEIKSGIVDATEEAVLAKSGLPFALALTLAFSAKESLFKALFPAVQDYMGFESARVTQIDQQRLRLRLTGAAGSFNAHEEIAVQWKRHAQGVCTLVVR